MTWRSLGSISPKLDEWSTLNAPAQQELFRFSQTWIGLWPGKGSIQIRMFYADSEFYEDSYFETRRIYATQDERLIYIPFNPVLQAAGYSVRYFQARFSAYSKILANANWVISIDEFAPVSPVFSDPSIRFNY